MSQTPYPSRPVSNPNVEADKVAAGAWVIVIAMMVLSFFFSGCASDSPLSRAPEGLEEALDEAEIETFEVIWGTWYDLQSLIYISNISMRLDQTRERALATSGRKLLDDVEIRNMIQEIRLLVVQALHLTHKDEALPLGSCLQELKWMEIYAIMGLEYLDEPSVLIRKDGEYVWQQRPQVEIVPGFLHALDDISWARNSWVTCKMSHLHTP